MYSYHLWIVLSETTVDYDAGNLRGKLDRLETLIQRSLICVPEKPIAGINGQYVLQCSESHNHRGDTHDRLLSVLEWISQHLPGSHGLVYWSDDEDPAMPNYNGYRVMVVRRGRVEPRMDPFLSPLNPVVEDDEPDEA